MEAGTFLWTLMGMKRNEQNLMRPNEAKNTALQTPNGDGGTKAHTQTHKVTITNKKCNLITGFMPTADDKELP